MIEHQEATIRKLTFQKLVMNFKKQPNHFLTNMTTKKKRKS
jgi:hypothetical protein